MTTFQVLSLIFLVSLIIGEVILKVIQKKGHIEESPYQWAFLLLGLLIGFSLFLSFTLPSLIIYWVISGINYFFGSQIRFNSQSDMYIFSLTVSIFAFIYMLFSMLLLKVAAIKFRIPKSISQAIEFLFFSLFIYYLYIKSCFNPCILNNIRINNNRPSCCFNIFRFRSII